MTFKLYIYIYIYIYIFSLNFLKIILDVSFIIYFILKTLNENLQDIAIWNSEDSNAILIKLLNILVLDFFQMYRSWKKKLRMKFIYFTWTKYERDNNGQNWVLLYGAKDDLKSCYKFIPYPLLTSSNLWTI